MKRHGLKPLTAAILFLVSLTNLFGQDNGGNFITYDIDNFWNAFDKITATKDRTEQLNLLNKLFIEKGSPGLKGIMTVRRYTDESYIDAINNYPLFWNSIRANTFKAKQLAGEIEIDVNKIKNIYPDLKPARIYFTIGALRTNGTTQNGIVLIGSELALADASVKTEEFPKELSHLRPFFDANPIRSVVHLNVHEYVHTQQKTTIGDDLLAQTVLEGVAEFVANTATGKQSSGDFFSYGKQHNEPVRAKFMAQMFNPIYGFWLYSNAENEFKVRDLGYYVGHAICEKYYANANDKKRAVKEMIELDYNNEIQLEKFVQKSGYFPKSIKKLKQSFEKSRPTVAGIKQFKNGDENVNPSLTQITIEFSSKMDKRFRNFEYGPLGENNALKIKKFNSFSEDGKSATFEVELQPNKRYQILVNFGFRDENGISLKPYLINFMTSQ